MFEKEQDIAFAVKVVDRSTRPGNKQRTVVELGIPVVREYCIVFSYGVACVDVLYILSHRVVDSLLLIFIAVYIHLCNEKLEPPCC